MPVSAAIDYSYLDSYYERGNADQGESNDEDAGKADQGESNEKGNTGKADQAESNDEGDTGKADGAEDSDNEGNNAALRGYADQPDVKQTYYEAINAEQPDVELVYYADDDDDDDESDADKEYYKGHDADKADIDESDRSVGKAGNIAVFGPSDYGSFAATVDSAAHAIPHFELNHPADPAEAMSLPAEEGYDEDSHSKKQSPAFIGAILACGVTMVFVVLHAKKPAVVGNVAGKRWWSTEYGGDGGSASSAPKTVEVSSPMANANEHWSAMPHASLI